MLEAASGSRLECRSYYGGLRAGWVSAGGEIDLATGPELEFLIRRVEHRALMLVVDLRAVTFMDSFGVHLLIDAGRRARRHGRRVIAIANPGSQPRRLIELTGVERVVEIVEDPASASAPFDDIAPPLSTAVATRSRAKAFSHTTHLSLSYSDRAGERRSGRRGDLNRASKRLIRRPQEKEERCRF